MDFTHYLSPVTGLSLPDVAALVDRIALGLFFSISGFHKAFNATRRASLRETFAADGVRSPAFMYAIPAGELLGGIAVGAGFLTPLAAAGLIVICAGACLLDGLKRVRGFQPLDAADALDDVLYLPEALYLFMLLFLILIGPGAYSVDAYLWNLIR
jgi:uncharacterized membrane protein YphA (DoxX/SURF4 family)